MKKYISIILSAIIALSPVYCLAEETVANEDDIIICANPIDYNEITGTWNTDGLLTKFIDGNGDYPTKSSFKNEAGGTTYYVDLGNKAGFYKTAENSSSFYAGAWVRLASSNTSGNFIVYSADGSSSYHRAWITYSSNNTITLNYYNGSKVFATTKLTEYANSWVYLGFARNVGTEQTTCTIYVNGDVAASGTNSSVNMGNGDVTISIATAKNLTYFGSESLGEVEILSVIPDEDEILKKYTDNAAEYKAAEQNGKIFSLNMTGEEATDTAGGATIEEINGACVGTHTYSYGITEPALVLPEKGYVKAESESLISGNDMTWELWISAKTLETGKIFAMGDDINNPEAHAVLQDKKIIFRAGRYDEETYVSSTVCKMEANKLYHLVFSRSYFESDGKGFFRYSAYCNSKLIQGFPFVRYGAAPTEQKTAMYIGGGIPADILYFNVYNEVIAPDNVRKMYSETVRPLNVSPAAGEENVSINKDYIELEYDLPVTAEMLMLQNITVKKNEQVVETVNTVQNNKILCSIAGGFEFGAEYSMYSGAKMLTKFKTVTAEDIIRYSYDFNNQSEDPKINGLKKYTGAEVAFAVNPVTGSRALKFATPKASLKSAEFSIDLPKAVDTKYVLVRMNITTTALEGKPWESSHLPEGPSIRSSENKAAAWFSYYSNNVNVTVGDGNYNGTTERAWYANNTADRTTISWEALFNLEDYTVTFINQNGNNIQKPLITKVDNIENFYFRSYADYNQTVYIDDIEVIGADDLSALVPPEYTVTGVTCEGSAATSLAAAAGKTLNIAVEKTGTFTLIAAIYDAAGALAATAVEADGTIAIDVPQEANAEYTARLFAWKSITDITPLLEVRPIFSN